MFNIKFKGIYKNEEQLIKNSKLPKNAIQFEEENSESEAFKKGLIFAIPIIIIMIAVFIIISKLRNVEFKYSIIHLIITSFIPILALYIHEIIHALTFPFKYEKEIYSNPKQMSLFVYCDKTVSKVRFIMICLMPTIILAFLPYIISLIITKINIYLSIDLLIISVVMTLSAVGDFTNVYNTLRQVPKKVLIFNYGYHSFWIKNK